MAVTLAFVCVVQRELFLPCDSQTLFLGYSGFVSEVPSELNCEVWRLEIHQVSNLCPGSLSVSLWLSPVSDCLLPLTVCEPLTVSCLWLSPASDCLLPLAVSGSTLGSKLRLWPAPETAWSCTHHMMVHTGHRGLEQYVGIVTQKPLGCATVKVGAELQRHI